MDSNVTYNAVLLAKSYDDATGSRRQSSARGVTTPDILTVKHMDIIDNEYKTPARRHTIRLDAVQVDAGGLLYKSNAYLVLDISSKATTAQVTVLVATFRAAIANVTAGSDIVAGVLNNES